MNTDLQTKAKPKFSKDYTLHLATIFLGFIIFGISENIKGPAIPRIQFDFRLDEMQIGTLLSLNALGYLIACSFTALLTRKIGIKWVSMAAFGSMAISGVFIFLSHSYPMFTASYFLMYIGNGMLEIGLAILAARIFVRNTGTMMNLSHFFYGISSTVAPMIASGLMTVTVWNHTLDWRGMYLAMLMLSVLPMIPALMSKFPGDDLSETERVPLKQLVRDPALWLVVMILSFGVVSEMAVGGWLVNFLEKSYNWEPTAAAGMLSAFFLCFSAARLLLGPITDRIGFTLSIIILSALTGVCTFIAIFGGESYAFLFAAAGIGIAPIYPTVMALIAKRYPRESDTAITFIVTMMGIGSVIGNYAIGAITNGFKQMYGSETELGLLRGLQAGYGFIGLCAVLCSLFGIVLYRYLRVRKQLI
ncbi:MFS transporter [Paenibacillus glucanolyticus]|uniref:MFS transporter n=1 Tax=Paenibacillus TaxID=44249 RepID=UPI0003E209E2|nr:MULTISPECIES: MFS transporter [Paenibacillus]ANA82940.1 MFS transporter [Paenibacillus glucanolyticus]AVV57974.1 MFS transporter [Paenibacillus glucanolyticus]ETT34774.1 major facilitator superfamily protein [Paenibacillus sp. FSL R5-808]